MVLHVNIEIKSDIYEQMNVVHLLKTHSIRWIIETIRWIMETSMHHLIRKKNSMKIYNLKYYLCVDVHRSLLMLKLNEKIQSIKLSNIQEENNLKKKFGLTYAYIGFE